MLLKKILTLLALSVAFAVGMTNQVFAFAGGIDGGGGRGVVCRGQNNEILSAELLDLWEARSIFGRTLENSTTTSEAQVNSAIETLKYANYAVYFSLAGQRATSADIFASQLRLKANLFLKPSANVVRMRDIKLSDTPDSEEPASPSACKVEQVVNFFDSQTSPRILINQDIFDKFAPRDQAALIIHEALYSYLRQYGETTSIRTRRAVGYVFAGGKYPDFDKLVYKKKHVICAAGTARNKTELYLYKNEVGRISLSTSFYNGLPSLGLFPIVDDTEAMLESAFHGDIDSVISSDNCSRSEFTGPVGFSVPAPGIGPSDFQREGWLAFKCKDSKLVLTLTAQSAGNPMGDIDLKCRVVEESNPHQ